jgi:hypothetical protein
MIQDAQAFVSYVNGTGQVLRWNLASPSVFVHTNAVNRNTKAIRYFIASDVYSAANKTAEVNAVRACFAQWQSVPGTILKFEEGGFVGPGVDINAADGVRADNTNAVFWAKNTTIVNGGLDDITGLRGYTVTGYAPDNTILEADIVLNAVEFGWFTDFNDRLNADQFVEATLLHEIGHFIGLDHSPVGGATVTIGGPGVSPEAGLSSDEIAAVRSLYPQPAYLATLSSVRGRVLLNGAGVFGAMVTAENAAGNVVAGTVTRANGAYELPAMPPGNYKIRATPLDPSTADERASLMRGQDIAADYEPAVTSFLPTANLPVTLAAGAASTLDLSVTAGSPPFRITGISSPSDHADADTGDRIAASIRPGQSNLFVGVASTTLPTNGATLTVTGDGLTIGPTIFKPFRFQDGRHVMSVVISVAGNATPGLRSFVVQQGNNLAYANGYLEVLPPFPDFNFDGFDDTIQRKYFPVFTAPEAAPNADPDQDGFNNRHESDTGSDPTNVKSFNFKIESVKVTSAGSTIVWQSGPGKRYQVFSRPDLPNSPWQPVGSPVTARGSITQFVDASATSAIRFYRVQQLP